MLHANSFLTWWYELKSFACVGVECYFNDSLYSLSLPDLFFSPLMRLCILHDDILISLLLMCRLCLLLPPSNPPPTLPPTPALAEISVGFDTDIVSSQCFHV